MSNNDYHFITHWRVFGTVAEVSEIMNDVPGLARWWPSVYLEVEQLAPGDAQGVGKYIDLYTKGWLPYTLRWQFRVSEVHPNGSTILAEGDFVGRGIWTFEQDGQWVNVTYDWKIHAEKPLLRMFSGALKPIFSANHHWAMARGEDSLHLELARRRAKTLGERALIPAPPPATTTSSVPLLAATLAITFMLYSLFRQLSHPHRL